MKRLLTAVSALCLMTGCAAESSAAPAPESSAAENSSAAEQRFDNAVFEKLCGEVYIAGVHVPLPGYAPELDPHFSLRFLMYNTELHLLMYTLEYDGTSCGFVYYDSGENTELTDDQLRSMPYYAVSPDADDDFDFSAGGIHSGDTEAQVIALLGEPDKEHDTETSDWFYYYPDPGELMIQFKDNAVYSITVDTRGNAQYISD